MASPIDSPLISLLQAVREWSEAREAFSTHRTEQAMELRELRRRLKEIIVWLELHDAEAAAPRLDAASEELKDKWWDFEYVCEATAPEGEAEPRCREAADVVQDAAGKLAGVLEDLACELPDEMWQGFDDV